MTGSGAARHFAPKNRPQFSQQIINDECFLLLSEIRRVIHNHPSGDPTPSRADIEITKEIATTGRSMGIIVHDHIIVGRDGHASLRGMQLI